MSRRQAVAKTYKLYLGGAFVRSESGRSDAVDGVNVKAVYINFEQILCTG